MGKPEGKRLLGRPRHRWEVNIKMDFSGSEIWSMDWFDETQDRDRWRELVHAVLILRVP